MPNPNPNPAHKRRFREFLPLKYDLRIGEARLLKAIFGEAWKWYDTLKHFIFG